MRGSKDAKPAEQKNQVLFINADAEYYAGRAQNYFPTRILGERC
ncbi:hypothetical protein [[Phormidium ambiguum] IAM M-71]